jgi:hypothetical protein
MDFEPGGSLAGRRGRSVRRNSINDRCGIISNPRPKSSLAGYLFSSNCKGNAMTNQNNQDQQNQQAN